jgi:hypothetical protein
VRKLLSRLGTVAVGLAMLGGAALLLWNMFGQGPYGDRCRFALGCRSYYCLEHELEGSAQVRSEGRCTKSCDADAECGAAAACVVLSEASRDDLPPFGKPEKACMRLRGAPATVPR